MASQNAVVDAATRNYVRDHQPANEGARQEFGRYLAHNTKNFPENDPLICEKLACSCCLLTARRLSPVIDREFQPKFQSLTKNHSLK